MKTDEIKIESGIPIPSKTNRRTKWPEILGSMKIGDSFEIKGKGGFYSGIRKHAKALNMELTCRTLGENHYRIWRIS